MKSFKDYIIEESKWSTLIPKFNGDINNDKEVEEFLRSKDFKDASEETIKNKIESFRQSYNSKKNITFVSLIKNGDYKAAENKMEELEKKSDSQELKNAFNKLRNAIGAIKAASVVTEGTEPAENTENTEDSEESRHIEDAIAAAEEADKVINNLGLLDGPGQFVKLHNEEAQFKMKEVFNKLYNDRGGSLSVAAKFLLKAAKLDNNEYQLKFKELGETWVYAKNGSRFDGEQIKVNDINFQKSFKFLLGCLILKTNLGADLFRQDGGIKVDSSSSDMEAITKDEGVGKALIKLNKVKKVDKEILKIIGNYTNDEALINGLNNVIKKLNEYKPEQNEIKQNNTGSAKQDEIKQNNTGSAKQDEIKQDNTDPAKQGEAELNTKNNSETKQDKTESSTKNNSETKPDQSSETISNAKSISRLNRKSSPDEIRDAVDYYFGTQDDNGERLDRYYFLIDKEKANNAVTGEERKSLKPIKSLKDKSLDSIEDNGNEIKENIVFDVLNNNPLLKENSVRNFFTKINPANIGRLTVGDNKRSNKSWENCKNHLKKIQLEFVKKAEKIVGSATRETASIFNKEKDLNNLKLLATSYNQQLHEIFSTYKKRNSYNFVGALAHDVKSDLNDVAKDINKGIKNSESGRAFNIMSKEINSHVEKLTAENFENAFNDFYKPIVGHYFANYDDEKVINDKDERYNNKAVIDAAYEAVVNQGELFGIGDRKELPLLAKIIINGNSPELNKIKSLIRSWDNNYNRRITIRPISDDLEEAKKNPLTQAVFNHLLVKQYCDAIKPGSTTIMTESLGNFMTYYYSKILQEEGLNNPQSGPTRIDPKHVRTFALYCLLSSRVTKDFKTACAEYLIRFDKTVYKPEDYLKAAEAYRQENANNSNFSKAMAPFEGILGVYNNGKGIEAEVDSGTNTNVDYHTQENIKPKNPNAIDSQNDDSETGSTNYTAPDQDSSVVTEPQATVTTSAVGSYTIPDRLTKQLIRRKMKSRIDSTF